MKSIRLKPASCLALAAVGSVALMPLDQNHAQECKKKPDASREVFEVDLNGPQADFGIVVTEHVITEADLKQAREQIDKGEVAPVPPKPEDFEPRDIRKDEALYDLKAEDIPKELICSRTRAMPQAINPAFTTDLYQQLRKTEGNVFFSPYSISEAMGMVYMGARENTAMQIATAMHFGADHDHFAQRAQFLRQYVMQQTNNEANQLRIANALCVTGKAPDAAYQEQILESFGAKAFDGGLPEINGWVKQQTNGHIETILEELDPDSACVLLNAVYFKGKWQSPFKPNHTHDAPFHVSADKQVEAKFMRRSGAIRMLNNEEWIAVELPYETSASMVIVMPAKADGMAALEAGLNEAKLKQLYTQLGVQQMPEPIELVMPKFKLATSYDLIPAMKGLGMSDAFTPAANFSGMYTDNSVFINQIAHKATLEVDEQGTVATAATAIGMKRKGAVLQAQQIRFDRPFLVFIKESNTNSTLFMGRVSDPTAQ